MKIKIVAARVLIPAPPPVFLREDSRVYIISAGNPLVPYGSLVNPCEVAEQYGIEVEINDDWVYSSENEYLYYLVI